MVCEVFTLLAVYLNVLWETGIDCVMVLPLCKGSLLAKFGSSQQFE